MSLKAEVLAPAGSADMLRAAVFAGADAVYLGLEQLNARRSAGNFSAAALREAVGFCHARGVCVYVTLNTIVYEDERAAAVSAIGDVCAAGADAVIVQDLGMARLVRECAPGLALHGSTQMSIHSLEGALELAEMGFSRAILARELSLDEIRRISEGCGIETEVFVHGALCMSVSGQCYMSAFLGGRSGNRGMCAGPCRLPFAADGSGACHLSLKDLSAIPELGALRDAGVVSFKIEGRLRTPEYAAAAVNACRASLDGQTYDETLLRDVFSRSGFTNAYIDNKRGPQMFGVRTPEDTARAKAALPRLRELFRRERPSVPVELELTVAPEGACVTVRDADGNRVTKQGAQAPAAAQKDPSEGYRRALEKTGGTPFYAEKIHLGAGTEQFVPAGEINALRRAALEELLERRSELHPIPFTPPAPRAPRRHAGMPSRLAAQFESAVQIPDDVSALSALIVPLAEWESVPEPLRPKTWLALPRLLFGEQETRAARTLETVKDKGFAGCFVQNLSHVHLCRGLPMFGGFGLNAANSGAVETLRDKGVSTVTLSVETTLAQQETIAPPGVRTAVVCYGHMPLMLTRACPLRNVRSCAGCNREGELTDRKGVSFPVRCTGPDGYRTVYNPVPLYLGDKLEQVRADTALLLFTSETRARCAEVLGLFAAHSAFDGAFTRGLYYKGTQEI